jgi:hypothetical protein
MSARNYVMFVLIISMCAFSFFTSKIVTASEMREVTIDCNPDTPTATPNPVEGYVEDKIVWKSTDNMKYKIELKKKNKDNPKNHDRTSPFNNFLGLGQDDGFDVKDPKEKTIKVAEGEFEYTIKCKNGHKADPMIRIPPMITPHSSASTEPSSPPESDE